MLNMSPPSSPEAARYQKPVFLQGLTAAAEAAEDAAFEAAMAERFAASEVVAAKGGNPCPRRPSLAPRTR